MRERFTRLIQQESQRNLRSHGIREVFTVLDLDCPSPVREEEAGYSVRQSCKYPDQTCVHFGLSITFPKLDQFWGTHHWTLLHEIEKILSRATGIV